jgi:hypothetical protein
VVLFFSSAGWPDPQKKKAVKCAQVFRRHHSTSGGDICFRNVLSLLSFLLSPLQDSKKKKGERRRAASDSITHRCLPVSTGIPLSYLIDECGHLVGNPYPSEQSNATTTQEKKQE